MKNKLLSQHIDNEKTLIYVHIGKCGGASLKSSVTKSPILRSRYNRVLKVHIKKPPICKNADYMVVIRNPIQRAISAFNWRYHLVVEDGIQRNRFPGEYEILRQYETLNNLSESLYVEGALCKKAASDFEKVHHLHERISFYLAELLAAVEPERIRLVLAQESLNNDIESLLQVQNEHQVHEHGSTVVLEKKQLSVTAYTNLKRYIADDYKALEKLLSICHTCEASSGELLK